MRPITRQRLAAALGIVAAVAACTSQEEPALQRRARGAILVPDMRGMDPERAASLIDELDLHIEVEVTDLQSGRDVPSLSPFVTKLARDVVVGQEPAPKQRVDAGTRVTLFVPMPRELRHDEEVYRLLTHCGLSFPLEHDHRFWLPADPELRATHNPPPGFSSDNYYDDGTVRVLDTDTLIYTSSTGIEVEYQPTHKRPQGCD